MEVPVSSHPSDQTLSSYGLGKLEDGPAESVHEHLEQCPECRKRVAEMAPDSFLGRVREAQMDRSALGHSQPGGTQAYKSAVSIPPPPADTLPPGLADHPDYVVKKELGRGGMGVVYLAHNTLMGRDEVLKVMSRQIIEKPGVLDRFLREIRAVAKLRHANIVTAYSAVRLGESIVFAMEYVDGLDLSKMVKAKGPLPVAHACNFVYQSALGLQHAHEEGLVHRDIKPGNLMLSRKGEKPAVKVLDFGLAKATREEKVDGGLTSVGQALGTPDFIAPEQILDAQSADIRADIYSLGGTLYYLLTGRPPFKANSLYDIYQAHISRDPDPLNFVRPEVPSELAALVAKMMAKDPGRRFQTPGEVAQALTPFFKKGSAPLKPVKRAEPVVAPAPTQPAPDVLAVGTEPLWDGLIDNRSPESAPEKPALMIVEEATLPRHQWPIVAAAAAGLFVLLLGIIIYFRHDEKGTTVAIGTPADLNKAKITPGVTKGSRSKPVVPSISRTPVAAKTDQGEFTIVKGKDQLSLEGGELLMTRGPIMFPLVLFGDFLWTDYDFTVDALRINGEHGFTLHVRDTSEGGANGFDCWYLGSADECRFHERTGNNEEVLRSFPYKFASNQWYTARVRVRGSHLQCFLKDGDREIKIFDLEDKRHPNGRVGLQASWSVWRFKNIKVTDPDGNVLWEGPPRLVTEAQELAKLQGTWGVVAYNGAAPTNDPAKTWTNVITGNQYVARHGDEIVAEGTLTLDSSKTPRWLDLAPSKGVSAGKTSLGIYDWRGEDWLIKHSDDQRPTDFSLGVAGAPGGLFLMRRMEGVSFSSTKAAESPAAGFVSLFNGKDLTGWAGPLGDYEVADGVVRRKTGRRATIYFNKEYSDFVARVQFRLTPGANDGLAIRHPGAGSPTSAGMCEIQVLDDSAPQYARARSFNGSAYGLAAAKRGHLRPVGEWNNQEVTVKGYRVKVELNGTVILDEDLSQVTAVREGNIGRDRTSGFFGLCGHGEPVEYRKIEIKDLGSNPELAAIPDTFPRDPDFVPLFNGRDLDGWKADPAWRVADGVLVASGPKFGCLYSDRDDYKDFHLRAEVRVNNGGNSGIYFRVPLGGGWDSEYKAQIGGENGLMALRGKPISAVHRSPIPPDRWFTYDVIVEGNHVITKAGGKIVTDFRDTKGPSSRGHIALEDAPRWGLPTIVEFRKIEIKEAKAAMGVGVKAASAPPVARSANGFVSLFNGKNLDGWKRHPSHPGDWRVQGSTITGSGPNPSYLYSDRGDFQDFHLRVEARINDRGNSGVFFRSSFGPDFPVTNPRSPSAYEAQINSTHQDVSKTGSLYSAGDGAVASLLDTPVLPGQWFTLEVIAEGNHIVIRVNGKTTADYTDQKRRYSRGHLALQHHDSSTTAEFRKIEIKELGSQSNAVEIPSTFPPDPGFVAVFNGRNLEGWKAHPSVPGDWRVQKGVLFSSGPKYGQLYSERDDYKDFHLRAEVRFKDGSNGGIYFRVPLGGGWDSDYEAQIGRDDGRLFVRGSFISPPHRPTIPIPPDRWFTYEVIAEGNHVLTKVGGKIVTDFLDTKGHSSRGRIALECAPWNGLPSAVVEFRKIEIKELSKTSATAAPAGVGAETAPAPTPELPVTLLARFRFDGNAEKLGRGEAKFALRNTTFQNNTLYLNGIYGGLAGQDGLPDGYWAVCDTPAMKMDTFSVALRFKAIGFGRDKNQLPPGSSKSNLLSLGVKARCSVSRVPRLATL